jgi:apolipoprotein N-acyltransferase
LLLAAAWPERGFTPLIFVALVPLLFVQQYLGNSNKKGMFWLSWFTFLIWNVLTTWWIWYSTSVGSVAAFVLNALFTAIVFQLFHISKKGFFGNKKGAWILIFYWMSWEYFHLNWDLSWSWLNLGNVFATSPKWIQWYEYTGTMGGTAWVIMINIVAYHILEMGFKQKSGIQLNVHRVSLVLLMFVPIIVSFIMYDTYHEQENPVEVVVVQPNTDPYNEQYDKDPMALLEKNLEKLKIIQLRELYSIRILVQRKLINQVIKKSKMTKIYKEDLFNVEESLNLKFKEDK